MVVLQGMAWTLSVSLPVTPAGQKPGSGQGGLGAGAVRGPPKVQLRVRASAATQGPWGQTAVVCACGGAQPDVGRRRESQC